MKQPFKISIDPTIIADLKTRLNATRWPDEPENDNWAIGTRKKYLQELCAYWEAGYDWPEQEAYLNSFSHYKADVDGFNLHFIYEKGQGERSVPLLLIHGWPDSFVRFVKLIPLLTQADENGFSFDVIVPSIPGYGFSQIPQKKGMNPKAIARLFNTLMTEELGYNKYHVHGGDWGSSITEQIALYHEDHVLGIHLTDVPFAHGMSELENPTAAEKKYKAHMEQWRQTEGAYSQIQGTKPQTLSYGLNDSPAGLAGWIIEKFWAWSDHGDNLNNTFDKDTLLNNLTIYWVTQTINSSVRLYYEAMQAIMNAKYNPLVKLNPFDKTDDKVKVPSAFALFPKDIGTPPREYAERFFNVQRWTEMPEGGHFAALEQPDLLAQDIRAVFSGQ